VVCVAPLGACHRGVPEAALSPPRVDGSRVRFEPKSPQLGALRVEAPREERPPAVSVNGRLAWDETSTVRIFSPFSGRVTQLEVEPGAHVERGAVLARIASSDYGQAEAEARKATSDLQLSEHTLTRVRDLYEHGAAARKDLEAAEAEHARANAEAQWTSARLAAYGEAGRSADGSFALRSPVAGVVVERNLSPGQDVRSDQMLAGTAQLAAPLFTITDPTHLWVMLDVSEHDAARLHTGDEFQVHLHLDPGRTLPGRLELVNESLDPVTRTVKARGTLANPDRSLRAEMLVNVEIEATNEPPVPQVPTAAVLLQGDKHVVFLEEAPGSFERREVAVGAERDGWLALSSGLEHGSRVVTQGALLLEKIYQDGLGS
jgi:cobalt-zinc-cadmium efflux system membrane fusion protein